MFTLAEFVSFLRLSMLDASPSLLASHLELPSTLGTARDSAQTNIVVLGESSAAGIPFAEWLSVGKIIVWQFEKLGTDRKFHLEVIAKGGDTLKGQHQKLGASKCRPDILIVYCGHNELTDVSWTRTTQYYVDDRKVYSLGGEAGLLSRVSPVCRLIKQTAETRGLANGLPADYRPGPIGTPAHTDDEIKTRIADFRSRLEAIADYGTRLGALTVMVIPPANDAGFDPNRSYLAAETTRTDREAFWRAFWAARQAELTDRPHAARQYRALLAKQPGFAEAHYRLATLLAREGENDEAYQHFVLARDLDGLPMRCLSSFHQVYRDVAEHSGCALVDGQALFHAIGEQGFLDDHLFHDAVHPSFLGQVVLAQGILDAIRKRKPFGTSDYSGASPIDPRECASYFGLRPSDWKILAERAYMYYHAVSSVRYDPEQRVAKMSAFQMAAQRIADGDAPESLGLPNIGIPSGPSSWRSGLKLKRTGKD